MLVRDVVLATFSLSPTCIGFLGKLTLFMVYVCIFISRPQQRKSKDLILTQLTVINSVTPLTQGVPVLMFFFDMENSLGNAGCQTMTYTRRVTRALTICSTCLLSMFHMVTISSSTSCLARLKYRAPKCILPSFLFFWILHLFLYANLRKTIVANKNINLTVSKYNLKYCSSVFWMTNLTGVAFLRVITSRDIFFVLLMTRASVYMVIMLHQYYRQVQHIHSTSLSPRSSAESRATQTILLLVTRFVSIYWITSSITLSFNFVEENIKLNNTVACLGACYSSLCPWVLIGSDPRVPKPQCFLRNVQGPSPPPALTYGQQTSSSPCSLSTATSLVTPTFLISEKLQFS
ncbi:vomeronasal type-1 receptor 3-like [Ornithorhynchus anatinus]|uniref:vomeronasal type-1 receptor 3-like n=1 Tax=Ornithorhynchus anatinus TaxID=9258 RepID=UPI0010A772D8|nr:vomeronasal type-1 receptor 3-like [Ornithorhynchus anatinus]